jgi:pyruvate/2-oxoglutarate dehydrogenase complex dihydrolipoamide dehydrogenase (E3) component
MTSAPEYDLLVLGGGSAGETAAARVAAAGRRVALVESRLVGGECPYWGCIPSKALLIAAARRRQAGQAHLLGAVAEPLDLGDPRDGWERAVKMRDERAKHLDDAEAARGLEAVGVDIIRGTGRVATSGTVVVGERELSYANLLISTGAEASVPPIEGLRDVHPWTSDDALTERQLPDSLLIVGGGAIGTELAQVYSTFGTTVTVVEALDRLLPMEEPEVSALVREVLSETGVVASLGVGVERVSSSGTSKVVHLVDGTEFSAEQLLVATGRRPRTKGCGLEVLGIDTSKGGISTGADARVGGHQNVFAAGDVTGMFPFTHTANYAGRVVAANVLGGDARMHLAAVPRGVFIDPPVAGVGLSTSQAQDEGRSVVRASMDVGGTARGWLESEQGVVVLVADAERGTLIGASAIGPRADEWISQVTLAVRSQVPVATLVDTIQPFPAVSEALFPAYEDLLRQLS